MKKLIILSITVVALIIGVMGFMSIGGQTEKSAKKDLEKYLNAMEKGDTDTAYKYLAIGTENLIDVLDYEYLDTLSEKDIQVKTTITKLEFVESSVYKKAYGTYPNYVDQIKSIYGNGKDYVVNVNNDGITYYKKGETSKKVVFLYDMVIANAGGQKLFKKVEFTLQWDKLKGDDGAFEITDITIR